MESLIAGLFLLTWLAYNGQFYVRKSRSLPGAGKKVLITTCVALLTFGLLYLVSSAVLAAWTWGGPVKGGYAFLYVYGTVWVAVVAVYILVDFLLARWLGPKVWDES